jgi:Rieske Fe-S protein
MQDRTDLQRRDFIKQTCRLCAATVGLAAVLPAVSSCAPLQTITAEVKPGGIIEVPLTSFASDNPLVVVSNASLEYEIAVFKYKDQTYKAFEMKCTHRDNPLVATKSGFFCNLHGSSFDTNGKVVKSPATANLKNYDLQVSDTLILIKI